MKCAIGTVQVLGRAVTAKLGFTFEQTAVASDPLIYLSCTSFKLTFWHGYPLLQINVTATGVADVPLMPLKRMSLNFTLDGSC